MRFYVVSPTAGIIGVRDSEESAERLAIVAAVHTGRPVDVHDRQTEVA